MKKSKGLLSDFLDWKGTYRTLPIVHRFIFFALVGLELDSYLLLFTDLVVPQGSFGILDVTYRMSHNPIVAIAVDLIFTVGYLYLSFWFLKKGLENGDRFAIILFGIALTSTEWIGLIVN